MENEGIAEENEGKRLATRQCLDLEIRFLAGFLASPYGVGNENAEGSLAKSL